MPSICMREEIAKLLPEDDNFHSYLTLMCCNFCKQIDSAAGLKGIDKHLKTLILPLFCALNRQDNAIMRMIGCSMLEDVASIFEEPDNSQGELEQIIDSIKASGKEKSNLPIIKCLEDISPNSYIKVIISFIYQEYYDLAFSVALCFIRANVNFNLHGFRFQPSFKTTDTPFMDLGVSLDEGITEFLTLEMLESKEIGDAYYFEVRFFKKFLETFDTYKNEIINSYFSGNLIPFLYKISNNCNKCQFYNMFAYTDAKEWSEALAALYEIKESLK